MEMLQIAATQDDRYRDWHLDLDFERRLASVDYQPIKLTRKEYELLAYLVRNAGEVVPSETLLSRVFGYSPEARTRTLHVHVRRLREKLGAYRADYIETIFGVGYRFQPYRPARPLKEPAGYGVN
jgi:DNA-binding response OmpR family regulator